jgi:fructose-specific phosphotransferase system IIA component
MKLLDILSLDCIKAPLEATNKQAAISELIDLLVKAKKVENSDALKEAVWTREQTRTTGIGHGLAIPHGKCAGVDSLALAIGRPAAPMDFQAIDAKPVRLIVLLVSPPDRTSDHIQALAHISRLMIVDDFREKMFAAQTPGDIYDLLRSQEQKA